MDSQRWVFLNGSFCLEEHASISIHDRGFLFGEGIFTTIRVFYGTCEFFEEHLQRLSEQAQVLHFNLPLIDRQKIQELIQRNQADKGIWRLKIVVTVKLEGGARVAGNFLMTLCPYIEYKEILCSLCVFPYPIDTPLAHLKSLSYLDHLYVKDYAKQYGYTDAIKCTREGVLLDTGCSNIFWIDSKGCWVPDLTLPYLKGIFLQILIRYLELPIHFVKATLNQICTTASIYTCNTLTHIKPVLKIDHLFFQRNTYWENLLQRAIQKALDQPLEYGQKIL